MIRNGHKEGLQQYRCKCCGRQFLEVERRDKSQVITDYIEGKLTLSQLSEKYGVSVRTISRDLEGMRYIRKISKDKSVVIQMDTTYWGTSGYNDIKPWLTDYDMDAVSFTGTRYDWGINNAISNGGNQAGLWHVLTIEQWNYIVGERSGSRFAKATVAGMRGLLLLPDGWSETTYTLNAVNDAKGGYASNTISSLDFIEILESNGVVFLPSAGLREGNNVNYVNGFGRYWSSSYVEKARSLFFHESDVRPEGADYHSGFSVRLVSNVN